MKKEDFKIGKVVWNKGHNEFMTVVKEPYMVGSAGYCVDVTDDKGVIIQMIPILAFQEKLVIPSKYRDYVEFPEINHKFYFTFGVGQPNEGCYVEIEAEDYSKAREELVSRYGTKWSFQYTEKSWKYDKSKDKNWMHAARLYGHELDSNPTNQAELFNLKRID